MVRAIALGNRGMPCKIAPQTRLAHMAVCCWVVHSYHRALWHGRSFCSWRGQGRLPERADINHLLTFPVRGRTNMIGFCLIC